jgi:hypothetical protein
MTLQFLAAGYAFRLEGESLRPLWLMPAQQVIYRQLMYAVLIQAVVAAAAGGWLRWDKLTRTGDMSAAPTIDRPGRPTDGAPARRW